MNLLNLAKQQLLVPGGLDEGDLQRTLNQLMGPGVDAADLYFQFARSESWALEDGIVRDANHSIEQGVGIRAVAGEKTGFAYSDEIIMPALQSAGRAARAIVRTGSSHAVQAWRRVQVKPLYPAIDPLDTLTPDEKLQLLKQADEAARAADPRVQQVNVNLVAVSETVLIAASDGTLAADIRPLIRMNVDVIAVESGRRERGSAGYGGRCSYQRLIDSGQAQKLAVEAVRQALVNLDAVEAPAGTMSVVVGPGWPAVLLHEAVGHGLEGDFNRKGSSVFSGRIGEQVASRACNIVDDATLEQRRGSLSIDDEGTAAQCTVLIEDGVLKGYMQDKLNGRLMGQPSTGNGRRESFSHTPMPRMTNTYMRPGSHAPQDIIESTEQGIYAVNFGSGQVDITNGQFVFSASEAYLIEKGKVTRPIRGATLIGNGPEILKQISMVGNDLALDPGIGVCGKNGQSVPVGVGQPTMKIDNMTVGGTRLDG